MSENPVREEERAAGYVYDVTQTFNGPIVFNGTVTFNGTILGVLAATGLQTSNAIVAVNLDPVGALGTVLTITGANRAAFVAPSIVVPGGADGTVQFNNAGAFGGIAGSNWNSVSQRLVILSDNGTNFGQIETRPDRLLLIQGNGLGTVETDFYINSDPYLQRYDLVTPFKLSKVSAGIEYAEIESGRLNNYAAVTVWSEYKSIADGGPSQLINTVLGSNLCNSSTVHVQIRVFDDNSSLIMVYHAILIWISLEDNATNRISQVDKVYEKLTIIDGTMVVTFSTTNPSGSNMVLWVTATTSGLSNPPSSSLIAMVTTESFGNSILHV